MRRVIPMRRRPLGSITWGTRQQNFLGFVTQTNDVGGTVPFDPGMFPAGQGQAPAPIASGPIFQPPTFPTPIIPIVQAPVPVITSPAATPPASTGPTSTTGETALPAIVPVIVTPSSGTIPDPSTVAAATTTDTTSWFEQQIFAGIPNWWLVAGAGLLYFMHNSGGKKR